MKTQTRPDKITLGRIEPDYSIDINDLFEIDMIEAEKEIMRREFSEGKKKSHPSILFSLMYMQRERKKDTLFYLQNIGKVSGYCVRNSMNHNYIKHFEIVKEYEEKRSEIGNAVVCRNRCSGLYKQYRISKICVDRYRRFFKGIWLKPSMKGKLINQYRCLSCGVRMPKNVNMFMCQKCENNKSEKFKERGEWKISILRDKIISISDNLNECKLTFFEAYHIVKKDFLREITPIRKKRRKEYEKMYYNNRNRL